VLLSLAVVLLVGGFVLFQSAALLPLNDAARADLEQQTFAAALADIAQKSPGLALDKRLAQARAMTDEALAHPEAARFEQEIAQQYQGVYRTPSGVPYAYDLDSYYYLERAGRNDVQGNLLVLLESAFYNLKREGSPAVMPSDAVFFLPVVFGLLTLTVFFFLALRLTHSIEVGLFAGLFLALQHRFYSATAAGMGDLQSLGLLVSVLFFWLVILAADAWHERKVRQAAIFGGLAALAFGVFALAWAGAVYVLIVLAAAVIVRYALLFARSRSWKSLAGLAAGTVLATVLFLQTAAGGRLLWYVKFVPHGPLSRHILELQGGSVELFVVMLGGWAALALAVFGCFLLSRHVWTKPSLRWLVMLAWLVLAAAATYRTVRFVYYVLPPLALFAAIGLHQLADIARLWTGTGKIARAVVLAAGLGVILLVLCPLLRETQHVMLPVMNDGIVTVGERISAEVPLDARIISWWDFGHFWRYAAKREPFIHGRSRDGLPGMTEEWWVYPWVIGRSFLAHDAAETRNGFAALLCSERGAIAGRVNDSALFRQTPVCARQAQGVVIVDEYMLRTPAPMADLVAEFGPLQSPVVPTFVNRCDGANGLLQCGNLTIDVQARAALDGTPILLFQDGVWLAQNRTADEVIVVYSSEGAHYAFRTTGWFARTALVRLFAGETLGMEQIAAVDEPFRVVAYRFRPPR
jgi:hypothetical protein